MACRAPLSCCVFMWEREWGGEGEAGERERALGSLPLSFKKVFVSHHGGWECVVWGSREETFGSELQLLS